MEQIILNGTIPELVEELTTEYGLASDDAAFMVYMSLLIDKKISPETFINDKNALDQYFCNAQKSDIENNYATQLFSWHYNMNYGKLRRDLLAVLFRFFTLNLPLCADEDSKAEVIYNLFELTVDTSISFVHNITKVPDHCFCVYMIAMTKYRKTRNKLISLNELCIYSDLYNCEYLSEKWECPHMSNEICGMSESKLEDILECLCKKNIFKNINKYIWEII